LRKRLTIRPPRQPVGGQRASRCGKTNRGKGLKQLRERRKEKKERKVLLDRGASGKREDDRRG